MAIYVKFGRKKSMAEFLQHFFSRTPHDGRIPYSVDTYHDRECTRLQCEYGRQRSFKNILELLKTYYKTASEEKLMHELMMLRIPFMSINYNTKEEEATLGVIRFKSCSTIKEINMYISINHTDWRSLVQIDQRNSKKSWKTLLAQIGVTNEEQYKNYRENYINSKNGRA